MNLKDAVELYRKLGFCIIPAKYGEKTSLINWKELQYRKPTDAEIERWFGSGKPVNVAVVCGQVSGNLVVLDFDSEQAYRDFFPKHEELERSTLVVRTGRGYHAYFRLDRALPSMKYKDIGFEVHSDGTIVIAPPSMHPSGKPYEFVNANAPPARVSADELDKAIRDFLAKHEIRDEWRDYQLRSPKKPYKGENPPCISKLLEGVAEGFRNEAAMRLASFFMGLRGLSAQETLEALEAWNAGNRPPLDRRELKTVVEHEVSNRYAYGCRSLKQFCEPKGCLLKRVGRKKHGGRPPILSVSPVSSVCTVLDVSSNPPGELKIEDENLKELRPKPTPGFQTPNGIIIEEVLIEHTPSFMVFSKGGAQKASLVLWGDRYFKPIEDELVQKGAISLPSGIEEFGSEAELIDELLAFFKRYVDADETYMKLAVVYVLTTWVYDRCPVMPIINLRGPSETGKSRFGEVMRHVCYRGMRASGVLSFSSLFRNAERWKGTLYINEADFGKSTEESLIVKYLNERYEFGGFVWRTDPETLKSNVFGAYGPTILVTRKGFLDDALESRCIAIYMDQTERADIPLNYPPEFYREAEGLRNKLLAFRVKHLVGFNVDTKLRFPGIGPRMNQVLQPMASLARSVSPELYEFIEGIAGKLYERVVEERAHSFDGFIVRAYIELRIEGKEGITAGDISDRIKESFGFDLDSRAVGRRLVPLGFAKRRTGVRGQRLIHIENKKIRRLICRYLPRDEREHWEEFLAEKPLTEFIGTDNTANTDKIGERPPMPALPTDIVSKVWALIKQLAPQRGALADKRELKKLARGQNIPDIFVDRILEHEAYRGRLIDRGSCVEPIR